MTIFWAYLYSASPFNCRAETLRYDFRHLAHRIANVLYATNSA